MKPRIKTNLLLTGVSLILALSFVFAQQTDEPPAVMLERAIQLETVDGDLSAAIDLYKRIEGNSASSRAVVARALLRLGGCYEKLGKDGARKAYERLVLDYADQPEQVKLARQRLAALSKISDADRKPVFVTRHVWTGPESSFMTAPSPDGRYLFLAPDLAVRDLETGVNRRLTNEGSQRDSEEYVESPRWSPDGKHIAYGWYDFKCSELRIISVEGGKSRTLVDYEGTSWMQVFDWSPDGKEILIGLEREFSQRQIALVSAADGETKFLKTFEGPGPWPQVMRFSRDGKYIAYAYPQEKDSLERDILVISIEDKREFPLVRHPGDDLLLGWTPDGKSILFASDRTGSMDMWLQTVSGGKVQGSPELVKRGVDQIMPLGFTQSGAFYYALGQRMIDVYSARIDFGSGKILDPPEVLIKNHEGRNSFPDYSPDGKYLAYLTTRSRSFQLPLRFNYNILCIRSLESGKELEFTTRFSRLAATQWSPDGQSLYLAAWDHQGENQGMGIYRVNAKTGEFTLIVRTQLPLLGSLYSHRVTPDGKTIIYIRQDSNPMGPDRIIARNLMTGEEKQLYQSGFCRMFSISPDGQWLALISGYKSKVLKVMPLDGGEAKELLKFEDMILFQNAIEWTPDAKYILFPRTHSMKDMTQFALWRIAADGGEPQKLNLLTGGYQNLSVHPDGQHLVFGSPGSTQKTTSIWVMENFIPPAASASE